MSSTKEYLNFILGQLSELDEVSYRAMMGEFIIYYNGRVVGGIYDDRLLMKPTRAVIGYVGDAVVYELPYDGAKPMVLIERVDDREYLCGLFRAMGRDYA